MQKRKNGGISFNKTGELCFSDKHNKIIVNIDYILASDYDSRTQGLMFFDKLEENQGMLFIFPAAEVQHFWMKDTSLPLDIIFVNTERCIIKIEENAKPFSQEIISSEIPVIFVVEVNSGFCKRYKISLGDIISWDYNKKGCRSSL